MKKVLLCIPTLISAGAQRFVVELAGRINPQKYLVKVVVTNHLEKTPYYDDLMEYGIEVMDVSSPNVLKEMRNISQLLQRERPDIVHTNVGAVLHMLLPTLLYGRADHYFTVHSMAYRIFCGKKKKLMEYFFHNGKVKPVAICDTVRQSIADVYHLKLQNIPCVYNGVDTRKFFAKTCYSEYASVFISVGRFDPVKNHSLMLRAFARVVQNHPSVKLVLVGDGDGREKMEKLVCNLGLKESVLFVGNQGNVVPYLHQADVYCSTSKVEGLPIAVLEAMSCGLPVVTTPAGGVVDIIRSQENGYVTDNVDNEQQLADAMEKFVVQRDLTASMGRKSREFVMAYDLDICARGYEAIYEGNGTVI